MLLRHKRGNFPTLIVILISAFIIATVLLIQKQFRLFYHGFERHGPRISSMARMLQITHEANVDLMYIPAADIVFMTMRKGGSTSLWEWIYKGVTGRPEFCLEQCFYVQNFTCHCWENSAQQVDMLPEREQWRVLTSARTIRVGVQREPFERLVSAWKNQFSCDDEGYAVNTYNRGSMVSELLRQAVMENSTKEGCLSVDEYANALERVRDSVEKGEHDEMNSLKWVNGHIKPQDFFEGEIDWDIMLNIENMGNIKYWLPIIDRLHYAKLVKDGPRHYNPTGGNELMMGEKAAAKLHRFASESDMSKQKYLECRGGKAYSKMVHGWEKYETSALKCNSSR